MTLFDRVFSGNDAVFGLTEGAIDGAIAQYGEDKAVSFPNTAYSLPCYYAVTGTKVTTLKELKEALGVVKTLMTREKRLNDAFMSGVATALCAEFIEVLKYIDGATPYEEPCYGHLADAVIRELGVPLVTGDIPGVAVILGSAPTVEEVRQIYGWTIYACLFLLLLFLLYDAPVRRELKLMPSWRSLRKEAAMMFGKNNKPSI